MGYTEEGKVKSEKKKKTWRKEGAMQYLRPATPGTSKDAQMREI